MRRIALLVTSIAFISLSVAAQQNALSQGIQSYKQADYQAALSSLNAASRDSVLKNDANVWNYLGLTLIETSDVKDAQKAFQKAIKLDANQASYHVNLAYAFLLQSKIDKAQDELENALKIDPKNLGAFYLRGRSNLWEGKLEESLRDVDSMFAIDRKYPSAFLLKSDVLIAQLGQKVSSGSSVKQEIGILDEARETLARGLAQATDAQDKKVLEKELRSVEAFYRHFSKAPSDNPGAVPQANVTPLKVISKPRAQYTDKARRAGISGTIQVAVLFGETGKVEEVLILKRLGHGLDENALWAANSIKFEPMLVDGKPVPTVKTVEYSFKIY